MSAASLISVLTFYIFSCSCLQRSRPRSDSASKHTVKASAHIWREEIENYPQRSATSYSSSSHHHHHHQQQQQQQQQQPPSTPITDQQPPVNAHHPPVVSAAFDTSWMTLPPPSAREITSLNRTINAHRVRSRSGSISSSEPGRGVPLEFENLVAGPQQWGRGRYKEGVLEDMDGPVMLRPGAGGGGGRG
ncbi:hypothetical protein BDD12DRAFT_18524 [Trichophaea hybrida]|nr:hypothetical protein BDD12DRAFT_18524 [Trichophaea hybrida]